MYCCQCNEPALLYEKADYRLFCNAQHHNLYHEGWSKLLGAINRDTLLRRHIVQHLGMKRSNEDEGEEIDVITLIDLEHLPDDVMGEILLFAFPEVGISYQMTRRAAKHRRVSLRMRNLIDLYLFAPVQELTPEVLDYVDDEGLSLFSGLKRMNLRWSIAFTEKGLAKMTRLEQLFVHSVPPSLFEGCRALTNLQRLQISTLEIPPDNQSWLAMMTNLINLELRSVGGIDDEGIQQLPQLKSLTLKENRCISGTSFVFLTQLEVLIIEKQFSKMKASVFDNLSTTLRTLELSGKSGITNETLAKMTFLTSLRLEKKTGVSDEGLITLNHLRSLSLVSDLNITEKGLSGMSKLISLSLIHNKAITINGLLPFKSSLRNLKLFKTLIDVESLSGFTKLKTVCHEYDVTTAIPSFPGSEKILFLWLNPPWRPYEIR